MNTTKICTLGYFDKVIVDGYSMPMFNNKGIEIKNGNSLNDAIDNGIKSYVQGIGKVRLTIYGQSTFNLEDDQLLGMRWHREQELKLIRTKVGNDDRYAIAYADLLILKSNESDFEKFKHTKFADMLKDIKSEDEYMLINKALEVQNSLWKKNKKSKDINVAIVDRVYVNKEFRQCGISKWIHENIYDIIKTYGAIDISAVILIPGDFSNEAETTFGLSKDEYRDMLISHYKNVGYKFIDRYIMGKFITEKKGFFSKK